MKNTTYIYVNFFYNKLKYIMNKKIDTMENDWLYEFQEYIKKFALLLILTAIILIIVLLIY